MYKIKDIKKHFKNSSRIVVEQLNNSSPIIMDVHNVFFELFDTNDKFNITLSNTYNDDHDYIMCGQCYSEKDNKVLISYGGLLMSIEKEKEVIDYNDNIYCFIDH